MSEKRDTREGAIARAAARDEAQPDAQDCKLRELAERVWNGAVDLVVVQAPAKVRAEGARREGERGERTMRVKSANEARRAGGASRLRGDAARGRGAGRRRESHKLLSFVSWPSASGMVPLIWLLYKYLRMCARKECEGGRAR